MDILDKIKLLNDENSKSNIINMKSLDKLSTNITESNLFHENNWIEFTKFNRENNKINLSDPVIYNKIETKFLKSATSIIIPKINLKYEEKSIDNLFKITKIEIKPNKTRNIRNRNKTKINNTNIDIKLYIKPSRLRFILTKCLKYFIIFLLIGSILFNYLN